LEISKESKAKILKILEDNISYPPAYIYDKNNKRTEKFVELVDMKILNPEDPKQMIEKKHDKDY
jgi:hypothetical protein